jgi:hypothetical protein
VRLVPGRVVPPLETQKVVSPTRLVRLKDTTDSYHRRRAEKHGYIYFVTRSSWHGGVLEAKSLATGVTCSLLADMVEEQDDIQAGA